MYCDSMFTFRYCWLLTEHPVLIVFLCAVIVSAFGSVAFIYTSYPDFGDPSKVYNDLYCCNVKNVQ